MDISPAPLVDHIQQYTTILYVEEDKIADKKSNYRKIGIIPSSLL